MPAGSTASTAGGDGQLPRFLDPLVNPLALRSTHMFMSVGPNGERTAWPPERSGVFYAVGPGADGGGAAAEEGAGGGGGGGGGRRFVWALSSPLSDLEAVGLPYPMPAEAEGEGGGTSVQASGGAGLGRWWCVHTVVAHQRPWPLRDVCMMGAWRKPECFPHGYGRLIPVCLHLSLCLVRHGVTRRRRAGVVAHGQPPLTRWGLLAEPEAPLCAPTPPFAFGPSCYLAATALQPTPEQPARFPEHGSPSCP